MRHAIATALFMSLFSSLFGAQKPDSKETAKKQWIIAEVRTSGGGKGIFRYPREKPTGWQSVPLSEEVSLTWKYAGVFPDTGTKASMDEMEDAITDLAWDTDSALVLVMTVGGQREWVFYTRDYEKFMAKFNKCLAGKPRYPLAIEHSHDPEWKYWHSFVDKLEKR